MSLRHEAVKIRDPSGIINSPFFRILFGRSDPFAAVLQPCHHDVKTFLIGLGNTGKVPHQLISKQNEEQQQRSVQPDRKCSFPQLRKPPGSHLIFRQFMITGIVFYPMQPEDQSSDTEQHKPGSDDDAVQNVDVIADRVQQDDCFCRPVKNHQLLVGCGVNFLPDGQFCSFRQDVFVRYSEIFERFGRSKFLGNVKNFGLVVLGFFLRLPDQQKFCFI